MTKPAATQNEVPPHRAPRTIRIEKEPSELHKILKFENLAPSGGAAKYIISQGSVRVNGAIETRKRKKIVSGDVIEIDGQIYRVTASRRPAP